jgi:hypothetical protein
MRHPDARVRTLLQAWDLQYDEDVTGGACTFDTWESLMEFFAAVTRHSGIRDFIQRDHIFDHPRALAVQCDLAEYLVGLKGVKTKFDGSTDMSRIVSVAVVLLREATDSYGRVYPAANSAHRYSDIPLEYVHEYLDASRRQLTPSMSFLLLDFHTAGIPATYAGTIPLYNPDARGESRGYSKQAVMHLFEQGVPAEYARDVLPLRVDSETWATAASALYRRGVPPEYAHPLAHLGIARIVELHQTNIPLEFARELA